MRRHQVDTRIALLIALLTILIVALCSCSDGAAERANFYARCAAADFSEKQCAMLFAMAKDAADDSASSAAISGVALGIAAVRK